MLDDDFKVGGVQVSTSLYVKDAATSICSYSCLLSFKIEKKIADTKQKKVNRIISKKNVARLLHNAKIKWKNIKF